jgi:hypothetical protein
MMLKLPSKVITEEFINNKQIPECFYRGSQKTNKLKYATKAQRLKEKTVVSGPLRGSPLDRPDALDLSKRKI